MLDMELAAECEGSEATLAMVLRLETGMKRCAMSRVLKGQERSGSREVVVEEEPYDAR